MNDKCALLVLIIVVAIVLCKDWRPKCNYQGCAHYENGHCKKVSRRKTRGFDNCFDETYY